MQSKTPRLRFTEEELDNPVISKAAKEAERAADKADAAKEKLPVKKGLQHDTDKAKQRKEQLRFGKKENAEAETPTGRKPGKRPEADRKQPGDRQGQPKPPLASPINTRNHPQGAAEAAPKIQSRIRFDDAAREIKAPGSRFGRATAHTAGTAVSARIHREIAQGEEDNVGVQAIHQSEEMAESAAHVADHARYSRKLKAYHKAAKLERKADAANVNALYQQKMADQPQTGSNPISRWRQKQEIRKQYAAAKAAGGATRTGSAVKGAEKATRETATVLERISQFASNHSHILIVGGLLGLLILFLVACTSSCSMLFQSGTVSVVATTYPSEDVDMLAAEAQYCALEAQLQDYLDNYERTHDYDEYHFDLDEIEHDPYVLISALTALMNGEAWTIDQVQDLLQMLFDRQYILTENVKTETRYRTETKTGERLVVDPYTGELVIDPDTGEFVTEEYEYEVEVPYTYYICMVTLENFNLSHVPVYIMSQEQLSMYALYMSTLGNRPDLFGDSDYVGKYYETEYEKYEIPPEALSNEQFANMIAEAEKYLGFPYVWGGSSPSTSFDCSGYVSWVINHCGNGWSVGRLGADGLRGICTRVSPANAKPGDLIFFQGTYDTTGASHVGIYVGENRMVHCGDPIQYTRIDTAYWQNHFLSFGRLPGM